jgi:hypothetical protein
VWDLIHFLLDGSPIDGLTALTSPDQTVPEKTSSYLLYDLNKIISFIYPR